MKPLVNKIKGFIFFMVAIFIFLSLISYHLADTPIRAFPPNIPVKNLTGIVGAYIAECLFICLGWAGYGLGFLLLIWSIARFLERPAPKLYIKILGTLILLFSVAVLLSLFGSPQEELQFKRAGMLGIVISEFLVKYFGRAGSFIISAGLAILASFVSTEFLLLPLLKWLAKACFSIMLSFKKMKHLTILTKRQISQRKREKPTLRIAKPKFSMRPLDRFKNAQGTQEHLRQSKLEPKIAKPGPVKKQISTKVPLIKMVPGDYKLPGLDLLDSPPPLNQRQIKDDLQASSQILEATLRDFGVETRVTQVNPGPVITRYELEPAPGVKIHRIAELNDDIALAMKAHSVRIVAPIPGKARVGVEVPNTQSEIVYLKDILGCTEFQQAQSKLILAIGKDISGQPIVTDLADMPHLLIAGTTGSGKTVCVNSIITSMLYNATPDEVKFLMVDPKMVELALFNELPHLLCPVLTNAKKVSAALGWVVNEMERRYKLLAKVGARNIDIYNEKNEKVESQSSQKMPYIVVIIDELADLMVVASQEVESAITRLAQLSRAVGIHLILATQRPSVDVITGVIKANFPARISFRVASRVDSRTVLDMNGADKLLGKGDLLFLQPGHHKPIRAQGSLISDRELERVVSFIKQQSSSSYNAELMEAQDKKANFGKRFEKDELFDEAVKVLLQTKQASVSMLQRRLGVGYTRAARLIDMMEEEGIVGPYRGSKPREILVEHKDNFTQETEAEEESN
jgi:S-DNA-T family DNA segregation ATPase FtsK/SpoIIIE